MTGFFFPFKAVISNMDDAIKPTLSLPAFLYKTSSFYNFNELQYLPDWRLNVKFTLTKKLFLNYQILYFKDLGSISKNL